MRPPPLYDITAFDAMRQSPMDMTETGHPSLASCALPASSPVTSAYASARPSEPQRNTSGHVPTQRAAGDAAGLVHNSFHGALLPRF